MSGRPSAVLAALYRSHALGLVRLAYVMLGDPAAAEDVVQDASCGLYRRWGMLTDERKVLQYARSAVLNGCRCVLRQRRRHGQAGDWPAAAAAMASTPSAEATALDLEQARALLTAVQRLPHRQREAVVLRPLAQARLGRARQHPGKGHREREDAGDDHAAPRRGVHRGELGRQRPQLRARGGDPRSG